MKNLSLSFLFCLTLFLCGVAGLKAQSPAITVKIGGNINGQSVGISVSGNCLPTPDQPGGGFGTGGSSNGQAGPPTWFVTAQVVPDKDYVVSYNVFVSQGAPSNGTGNGVIAIAAPPGFQVQISQQSTPTYGWSYSYGPGSQPLSGNFTYRVVSVLSANGGRAGTATSITSGQVRWQVALGSLKNGNPAGSIVIADPAVGTGSTPWSGLFTPAALQYLSPSPEIITYNDASGQLRQILANQAYVDIVTVSSTSYRLDFYAPCSLSGQTYTPTTPYVFSGSPYVSYLIKQGGTSTTFQILETLRNLNTSALRYQVTALTRTGTALNNFNWVLDDWNDCNSTGTVATGAQLREEKRVWGGTTANPTETVTLYNPNTPSTVDLTVNSSYQQFNWGLQLVSTTMGSGTNQTPASSINYITAGTSSSPAYGLLSSTVGATGTWMGYDYLSSGADSRSFWTVSHIYKPFNNQTLPATFSTTSGEVTTSQYTYDNFGAPTRPTSIVTQVNGVTTAKLTFAYTTTTAPSPDGQAVISQVKSDSFDSSAATLNTTTKYYAENVTDDFFTGKPRSTTQPDGVQVSYAYQRGTYNVAQSGQAAFTASTNNAVNTSSTGSSMAEITGSSIPASGTLYSSYNGFPIDPLYLVNGKSTLQVTLRDSTAQVCKVQSYVWLSGAWALTAESANNYDASGQLTSSGSLNGAMIYSTYDGDRAMSVKNASGITINYTYDAANRTLTEGKAVGPLTTYAYNSAGKVVSKTVSDGGVDTAIVTSTSYDDAGRITSETPAGLSAINYSYFYGANAATTTGVTNATFARKTALADTGYKYDVQQIDGRQLAVVGTAVVEQDYTYALDSTSSGFLDTTAHSGGATSARWTTTVTDWLGRTASTTRPGYTGQVNFVVTNKYDTTNGGTGHLLETDRTGLAPTKYQYDAMDILTRTGMDLNNDSLALASTDVVSDTNQVVEQYTPPGGTAAYWLRQDSIIYPSATSTPLTTSITRKRLTGFPANRLEETRTTDSYGNTIVQTSDVNTTTQTITSTTTLPGVTNPLVETMVNGLKTKTVGVDGLTTNYAYDGLERPKSVTDTRGNATTTAYIAGTNLVSTVTDATSTVISTATYDTLGRQKSVTNANGFVTYSDYNLRSQLLHQWGNATYPVSYGYDPTYGERTSMITYAVAASGSPFTTATWPVTPPAGATTQWAYDGPSGLLTTKTDAASQAVTYTYNQIGQVATRAWARVLPSTSNHVTSNYTYDTNIALGDGTGTGRLKSVSYTNDPTSTPTVSYTYTRTGQMKTVTDGTGTRTLNYNNSSQPLELSTVALDATYYNSRILSQVYNSDSLLAGRPTGFQLGNTSNASADLAQTYQFNGNGYFSNLTTASQAGANSVTFAYGYLSNAALVQSIGINGNASYSVNRGYEAQRNLLTSITNNWGVGNAGIVTQFNYSYDSLGQRVFSAQSGSAFADYYSGTSYASVFNFHTYDSYGQLKSRALYRGATPTGLSPPASTDQFPGHNYMFGYDTIGNRTSAGETGTVSDDTYTANNLNQYDSRTNNTVRITGNADPSAIVSANVAFPGGTVVSKLDRNFALDVFPANNLAGPAQGSVAITATLGGSTNTVNRSYFVPAAKQSFTYDLDGNLLTDGVWNYGYDAENRLIAMTSVLGAGFNNSGVTLSFAYDYLNRRVEKKVFTSSSTTLWHRFVYDGWNLVAETDEQNAHRIFRSYSWGLDLNGSLTASGGVGSLLEITNFNYSGGTLSGTVNFFPQYDGNGNLSSLVRGDGTLAAAYEYGPFGETLRKEIFDSAVADNSFRFSTKYTDTESGLVYFGNRFYSPTLGRFINRDVIAEAGGLNLYGFCGNDGINHFDVLGNSWLSKLWDRTILSLGKHIAQNWDHGRKYIQMAVAVIAAIWLGPLVAEWLSAELVSLGVSEGVAGAIGAFGGGFVAGTTSGLIMGQSMGAALKNGLISGAVAGVSAGFLHGLDGAKFGTTQWTEHALGHAILGGAAQSAQGGNFWSGFAASGVTSGIGSSWIKTVGDSPVEHTLIAATLGGAISAATGGSFYNGAINSGVEWAYNEEGGKWSKWWKDSALKVAWTGAKQGFFAAIDGMNPFGNFYADLGYYDRNDPDLQASRAIGKYVVAPAASSLLLVGGGGMIAARGGFTLSEHVAEQVAMGGERYWSELAVREAFANGEAVLNTGGRNGIIDLLTTVKYPVGNGGQVIRNIFTNTITHYLPKW